MKKFLVDLHTIIFVYVTGQVEVSPIWQDLNAQRPFITVHKVHEMSTEILTISFMLFFEFVGYMHFVKRTLQALLVIF
jgi:hypothetical protein